MPRLTKNLVIETIRMGSGSGAVDYATEVELLLDSPSSTRIGVALDTGNGFLFTTGHGWRSLEESRHTTEEALIIPLAITDGVSIPENAGIMTRQTEWDALLNGSPGFSNIQEVHNHLPFRIGHETILRDVEGAVYRPDGSSPIYGWQWTGKELTARYALEGAGFYEDIVDTQNITSVTAWNSADRAPSVTCSGTPFAGLDLRGQKVVFSNDAEIRISHHDDSTLYLMNNPSPAVTPTHTLGVVRSTSVLRNSADDASRANFYFAHVVNRASGVGYFEIKGFDLDLFNSTVLLSGGTGFVRLNDVIADNKKVQANFGIANTYYDIFVVSPEALTLDLLDSAFIGGSNGSGPILATVTSGTFRFDSARCVFAEYEEAVQFFGRFIEAYPKSTVFDDIGDTGSPALIADSGVLQLISFGNSGPSGGVWTRFKNCPNDAVAVRNGELRLNSLAGAYFENVSGDGIVFIGRSTTWSSGSVGPSLYDGGGNQGFGINIQGKGCVIDLPQDITLSGAAGDCNLIADPESPRAWADVVSNGPIAEATNLNVVEAAL